MKMDEPQVSHTEEPLVSVIVPIHNAAEYLGGALESLRSQSYARFEAILVNDGSTDDSPAICHRFSVADKRFRILNQPNLGVSAARNAGIDAAAGKWIAFLDADDLLYPESLRPMLKAAARNDASIVAANYTTGSRIAEPKGSGGIELLAADEAIRIGLYQKRILNNPWGMLFDVRLFRGDNAPRFRQGRYEDLDIFYRLFEHAGQIALLDRTVYFYRDNPTSFINTWSESRLDALDVTDRIVSHYEERLSRQPTDTTRALLEAALDRRFSAHYNILLLMLRNRSIPPGQRGRCLEVIRRQRLRELTNPNVRLKNKIGALLSYGGLPILKLMAALR